jgi:Uma2 family endonuclease
MIVGAKGSTVHGPIRMGTLFDMSVPQRIRRFTPKEYYDLEHKAEYKSDYYDGEIFAMAGGTSRHSLICTNLIRRVGNRLDRSPCAVYESNLRFKVMATGLRTYPDVSVYCGPLKRDDDDPYEETYINPTVVFEVLSKSTEGYDRGFKAESYRQVESLKAYVLVSQESPHAEIFERQPDGSWLLREARGLDATLAIPAIDVELPLAEIYDRVEFSAAERPEPNSRGGTTA